jgi:hypothetical protein
VQYGPSVSFDDSDTLTAWSRAAIEAIQNYDPSIFTALLEDGASCEDQP